MIVVLSCNFLMNFIPSGNDNRGMAERSGYRQPDPCDYILSDLGAGTGWFFPSRPPPPEDAPLRYCLHRACLLLARGTVPREVCRQLEFPGYGLFCRRFEESMGMSPGEYREWVLKRREEAVRA